MYLVICPKTSPASQCKPVLVQHLPHHSPPVRAEAPHLVTAGPAGLAGLPGTIISPEMDAMGKRWRLFPKGAVNPLLLCRWELVLIPSLGLASEHKETPERHHPASCTCSNGFAGPQLLMHQPPALLSQLSES